MLVWYELLPGVLNEPHSPEIRSAITDLDTTPQRAEPGDGESGHPSDLMQSMWASDSHRSDAVDRIRRLSQRLEGSCSREVRGCMKILTPEEKAFAAFNKIEIKVEPRPCEKSPIAEMSDADYAASINEMIESDVAAGWDIVREEAEEALNLNPDDEHAKTQMLHYEQWKRQQVPVEKRKSGLTIAKKGRQMKLAKAGAWVRDHRHGWLIRASGCDVGDVVPVRKKGGIVEQIKLTQRVWEGVSIFKGVRHE